MSTHDTHEHNQSPPAQSRPFSIDLSIELERQLDNDSSPPSSPAHDVASAPTRESLDPHILASIIVQLRHSLADVTKERDDLASIVSSLKASLEHMSNKYTVMESELHEARDKAKDDEEAISMLRSKVEESRRGLMRLQTESRRSSGVPAPIDVSRAAPSSFAALGSSRRQSFTPLTGKMNAGLSPHRRNMSVTDGMPVDILVQSASPSQPVFSCETPGNGPTSSSRRLSSFFARSAPESSSSDIFTHELDGLRRELRSVQDELESTKAELDEARETRDASESCVIALREFITENNIGAQQSPIPSTPTNSRPGPQRKSSAWGFTSIFKSDTSSKLAPTNYTGSSERSPSNSNQKSGLFAPRTSMSSTSSQPLQIPTSQESDASSIDEAPEPVSPSHDTCTKVMVNSAEASRPASPLDLRQLEALKLESVQPTKGPVSIE
jgi:hypothetical protein